MGFFSALGRTFGIGAGDPAAEARNAIQAANVAAQGTISGRFGETKATLDPFLEAGAGALPEVVQGATIGGFAERLKEIFGTDIFRDLVEERTRGVEGQLSAGGLTRSGTALEEISKIPTEIGLFLENLLTGRATGLAGTGLETAFGLGGFGAQEAGRVADIQRGTGRSEAAGILRGAGDEAAGVQNVLRGVAGGLSFFSDARLKENVRKINKYHGLNVYRWKWKPETKGTMVEYCGTVGFMADEVKEIYPHHVYEFGGFDVIDYPTLLNELETS